MPLPIAVALGPVLSALASNGLSILSNAILAKGKDVVEEKLGVKIPDDVKGLTADKISELRLAEMKHEEFLVSMTVRKHEADLDAEKAAGTQVTERWKADMSSDSWLSKNVRPLTLVYWTVAITVLMIADRWLVIREAWIKLIEAAYLLVLGAYFVGRTIQHGFHIVQKGKNGSSH